MGFDPTKPVQTRDGRRARILCVDAMGSQPIVALIQNDGRFESEGRHHLDGSYNHDKSSSTRDLINVPQKREGWINIYPAPRLDPSERRVANTSHAYDTQEEAGRCAFGNRIACVKVEWEEP